MRLRNTLVWVAVVLGFAAPPTLPVSGILKLHGKEHELMVATTVTRSGDRLTASTHFVIPYMDWGLKNPGGLLLRVGNQVQIDLKTVGRITLPASN